MKKVNLHTHSIYSDGNETPERIAQLAALSGVELLSLTDHNTFRGYPRFKKACAEYGVNYIKGVEIDCVQPEINFHQELLAYFPNGGDRCLTDILKHKQSARKDRVLRALNRASSHFSLELKLSELEAMAIAEKGFIGMISNKLTYSYILTKQPNLPDYATIQQDPIWKTFWLREQTDTAYTLYELIELISKAGGYTSLAHFGFHFGANAELMRAKTPEYLDHLRHMKSLGLWGIELHPYRYYPQASEINAIIKSWAKEVGLNHTTGSDFHGGALSEHKTFEWFEHDFNGFKK